MKEKEFKEYYKRMLGIILYKEQDEKGTERKCMVSVEEAKKNPNQYKIFTCRHPALKGKEFAYDYELVQKQANTLKEISRMVPHTKYGFSFHIYLKDLLNLDNLEKRSVQEYFAAEIFLEFAKECDIIECVVSPKEHPNVVRRNIKRKN